ncbi:MAG: AEC family transporter [Desulfosarcinaceae bacterium]
MEVFSTIIPIFGVVILGWFARKKGFIPVEFIAPANRLVYYLAIPALIFRAVAKASFRTDFNPTVLLVTILSAMLAYLSAWLIGRRISWPPGRIGAFIQCAGHGNHGYIGLPVAFYFLGESGLAKTSILASFLFILQNMLSVMVHQAYATTADTTKGRFRLVLGKLSRNPIIVSALVGLIVSLLAVPIPTPFQRFLEIMSGLAPPMSLLLIGTSVSLTVMRRNLYSVLGVVCIKIIALPTLGLCLYAVLGVPSSDYLPSLILLATPTATVAYVMSREMQGDAEFAGAAISTSTLFSALTYLFWLTVVS